MINSAVDTLLKKEFDEYRAKQEPHPIMTANQVDAVPYQHEKLNDWRDALHKGMQHLHKSTNLLLTGAVDDIWVKPNGEIIIVDYKATSKKGEVSIDGPYQVAYKRQMDFYAWLFRQEGFKVSDTGYFVYANALTEDVPRFEDTVNFKTVLIPYNVDTSWVEEIVQKIKATLESDQVPESNPECEQCQYNLVFESVMAKKNSRVAA